MLPKSIRSARISLTLTVVFMAISGLSLSLIPFIEESTENESSPLGYTIAAVFWLGLVAAIAFSYITKMKLQRYREKLISRELMHQQRLPGVISFSIENTKNVILYGAIVIGLIMIVTDIVFGYVPEAIMLPIVSVTIILFAVHCVVDGKYYKVYQLMKECMKHETKD